MQLNNFRLTSLHRFTAAMALIGTLSQASAVTTEAQDIYISKNDQNVRVYKADMILVSTLTNFNGPEGMAFDGSGNLYAASRFGGITEDTSNGTFIKNINTPVAFTGLAFAKNGNLLGTNSSSVYEITTSGTLVRTTTNAGLNGAAGIVVDGAGNFFVASEFNHTGANDAISEFSSSGTFIKTFGSETTNSDRWGLAFDTSGNLYMTDRNSSAINEYDPGTGTLIRTFSGLSGGMPGIAFDNAGNLWGANSGNIIEYAPNGTVIHSLSHISFGGGDFIAAYSATNTPEP